MDQVRPEPARFPQSVPQRPRPRWADQADDNEDNNWKDVEVKNIETKEDLTMAITQVQKDGPPRDRARRLCLISGMTEDDTKHVVTEMFSPPRVNARIRKIGARGWLRAGSSFELVVDSATGESWDFLKASDRKRCWERLVQEDPWVVIGSPPCTAFSNVQNSNKERCDPVERHRKLIEGKVLLRFALDVYC